MNAILFLFTIMSLWFGYTVIREIKILEMEPQDFLLQVICLIFSLAGLGYTAYQVLIN